MGQFFFQLFAQNCSCGRDAIRDFVWLSLQQLHVLWMHKIVSAKILCPCTSAPHEV